MKKIKRWKILDLPYNKNFNNSQNYVLWSRCVIKSILYLKTRNKKITTNSGIIWLISWFFELDNSYLSEWFFKITELDKPFLDFYKRIFLYIHFLVLLYILIFIIVYIFLKITSPFWLLFSFIFTSLLFSFPVSLLFDLNKEILKIRIFKDKDNIFYYK
jgi:hypothetical protein